MPIQQRRSVLWRSPFIVGLKKQSEEDYDIIAYFKDREDDEIPVPYSESYHVWLGGFASEVERALVEPFMFVSSNHFVDALDRQANLYGLSARRLPGEDRLNVEIRAGELRVELNLGPILFRISARRTDFRTRFA